MSNEKQMEVAVQNLALLVPNVHMQKFIVETVTFQDLKNVEYIKWLTHYAETRVAFDAAKRLGLDDKRALEVGTRYKRKYSTRKFIARFNEELKGNYGLDPHSIVRKTEEIVDFDPIHLFDERGAVKHKKMADIPPDIRRCIESFEVREVFEFDENKVKVFAGHLIKVKLYNKLHAMKMLGSQENLFTEKKELNVKGEVQVKDFTKSATKRMAERPIIDVKPIKESEE